MLPHRADAAAVGYCGVGASGADTKSKVPRHAKVAAIGNHGSVAIGVEAIPTDPPSADAAAVDDCGVGANGADTNPKVPNRAEVAAIGNRGSVTIGIDAIPTPTHSADADTDTAAVGDCGVGARGENGRLCDPRRTDATPRIDRTSLAGIEDLGLRHSLPFHNHKRRCMSQWHRDHRPQGQQQRQFQRPAG